MISLEQIQNLEARVHAAVSRIKALSTENATLKQRLGTYEERVAELETLVSAFKADQEEIEAGIVAALSHLDELEDSVSEPAAPPADTDGESTATPQDQSQPDEHDEVNAEDEEDPELDIF